MTNYLALVACGAPLASRTHDVAQALMDSGWDVTVAGTSASRAWLDVDAVEAVTGRSPLFEQRGPTEPKRGQRPDCVVVCPLTLNTGSKLVLGLMDNYAVGIVCEALAVRTPVVVVPMISTRLWGHPAWSAHVKVLMDCGVRFIDPRSGLVGVPEPVESGTGASIVSRFDPMAVVAAVRDAG